MARYTRKQLTQIEAAFTPEERLLVRAAVGGYEPQFRPNEGPQTEAFNCTADILGYGGAAGGGKSMLLSGAAITSHKRSLIIRQEKTTTKKFVQDITKMRGGDRTGYSSQGSTWSMDCPDGERRLVEFAGLENEGDEEKQQGVDYDLKCVGAGTLVWMADGSRRRVEDVEVGDMVDTLSGPRRVTRTIRQTKEAVLVTTPSGQQVQGASHQLLGPCGWRSSADAGGHQPPTHPGFSSPTPSRCACRCAVSLSPTSSALSRLRDILSRGPQRRHVSGQGLEDRRSSSAIGAGTASTAQGAACAKLCGLCPKYALHLSQNPLLRVLALARLHLSVRAIRQRVLPSGGGGELPQSSPLGSRARCRDACCSYGERPRLCAADDQRGQHLRDGVEQRNPIYLLEDEGRQTHRRTRRTWSYGHPYTKEKQTTDRRVRVEVSEYSDAGVLPLFDLTVEEANHYITNQGFVNRNCYDEVTQMREAQVRYTMGWVRTDDPAQQCRVIMCFNPPTTAEGRWVIKFFAPWLDRAKHPNPAEDGELRWFATIGDNADFELPVERKGEEFVVVDGQPVYEFDRKDYKAEDIVKPKSRTFITAKVTDNPYYMRSGYISQLQSLPEPLRSQMLRGDFSAGIEDAEYQVIPTAWIEAAMDRWYEPEDAGAMDSMGVDAARGGNMGATMGTTGKDKMVIARRHGLWFDKLVSIKGIDVNTGSLAAAQVVRYRRDNAPVHLDVAGIGVSPYDFMVQANIHVEAINNAAGSVGRDRSGLLSFCNLRAETYWMLREALDPENNTQIMLPDDAELLADLAAPTYRWTKSGILLEPKEDLKKRIGRSPDKGDAVVLANISTPRRKMVVGPLADVKAPPGQSYDENRFNELGGR